MQGNHLHVRIFCPPGGPRCISRHSIMLRAVRLAVMMANSPSLLHTSVSPLVHERVANSLGAWLDSQKLARIGLGIGVVGDDLDAFVPGLAQRRRNARDSHTRHGDHPRRW